MTSILRIASNRLIINRNFELGSILNGNSFLNKTNYIHFKMVKSKKGISHCEGSTAPNLNIYLKTKSLVEKELTNQFGNLKKRKKTK
jgi:hypothetical protein